MDHPDIVAKKKPGPPWEKRRPGGLAKGGLTHALRGQVFQGRHVLYQYKTLARVDVGG